MDNTILSFQNTLSPELFPRDNKIKSTEEIKLPEVKILAPNDFTLFSNSAFPTNNLITPISLFNDSHEIDLPAIFDKNEHDKNDHCPTFAEVKKGSVMEAGQKGPAVKELQNRLTKLGYGVQASGEFGPNTEAVLKNFQKHNGIAQTGKFGPGTLNALETAEKSGGVGKKLATQAKSVAKKRNTFGQCYNAVAESIDKLFGNFLRGGSAYMASSQLAASPKFKELKVSSSELPNLPAGAVVVWGKTHLSPDGHISVALGDGREASDHITNQLKDLRGYSNYRVFLPVKP